MTQEALSKLAYFIIDCNEFFLAAMFGLCYIDSTPVHLHRISTLKIEPRLPSEEKTDSRRPCTELKRITFSQEDSQIDIQSNNNYTVAAVADTTLRPQKEAG